MDSEAFERPTGLAIGDVEGKIMEPFTLQSAVSEALKHGASKVVAIEPAPINVECLRRNFAAEIAAGRVIVAPVGVWDKDDELPLYEFDNNSAADSFIIKGKTGRVAGKIALTRSTSSLPPMGSSAWISSRWTSRVQR
jgi:hypothetical protein